MYVNVASNKKENRPVSKWIAGMMNHMLIPNDKHGEVLVLRIVWNETNNPFITYTLRHPLYISHYLKLTCPNMIHKPLF